MKLYVLVRKDMSLSQIAVQAGHAVGEWCKSFPLSVDDWNDTLVYLGVKDEEELQAWANVLMKHSRCREWREGYWNNSLTSLAVLGSPEVKELVKELKLV